MTDYPTKVVRGATVRADPAREACFKVVARALRMALRREGDALPSSKGVL